MKGARLAPQLQVPTFVRVDQEAEMQTSSGARKPVQAPLAADEQVAVFVRAHLRRPSEQAHEQRFSARLALQRAFVAAPTD